MSLAVFWGPQTMSSESISSFASVMNELKKKLISSVSARV